MVLMESVGRMPASRLMSPPWAATSPSAAHVLHEEMFDIAGRARTNGWNYDFSRPINFCDGMMERRKQNCGVLAGLLVWERVSRGV